MSTRTSPIFVMAWQSSLGAMKAHGTRIRQMGGGCDHWSEVDVGGLIDRLGAEAHLWDERAPCPVCGVEQFFAASPGGGTPFTPMIRQEGRRLLLP